MKSKVIIILLSLVVIACNSSKKTTEDNLKSNQSFFKENSVYSELAENNYYNLFYFNSENNTVYFSKIKKNDTLNKTNKSKLKIVVYGEYEIQGNILKIQKNIEKKIRTTGRNFFQSILFTFPLPAPRTKHEVTIVDKKIIIEGQIKKDTINSFLIYEPKFKGIVKKDNIYDNYSGSINLE